jgi:hypothetical protein
MFHLNLIEFYTKFQYNHEQINRLTNKQKFLQTQVNQSDQPMELQTNYNYQCPTQVGSQ